MLNRIEAKNFKAFKRLDYKCAKLNLLMGLNGAGKSSFVQLMLLLRATANKIGNCQAEIDLRESGIAKSFSDIRYCYADKDEQTSFSVDFTGSNCLGKNIWLPDENIKRIGRVITESAASSRNVLVWHPEAYEEFEKCQKTQQEAYDRHNNGEIDGEYLEHIIEKSDLDFEKACKGIVDLDSQTCTMYKDVWLRMRFIESFRKRPIEKHESRGMIATIAPYFPNDPNDVKYDPEGGDIAEFLYKLGTTCKFSDIAPIVHPSIRKKGGVSTLIEQVDAWLDEISPGARFCVEREQCWDDEIFIAKIGYGEDGDMKRFKPQNVGLGISYVLPVLGTLLTAGFSSIVIIENPEAHIHPRGQAKLGELIARATASGAQVFVETHSDHVINGVRVAVRDGILKPEDVNIAFFERKEHLKANTISGDETEMFSEVGNIKIDHNGSLSRYPNGFLDEWNNQLLELAI